MPSQLQQNLEAVHEAIGRACRKRARSESSVKILAVTKTLSIDVIEESISCGLTSLGENYVQEAVEKIDYFRDKKDCPPIQWHFIGKLQSNKSAKVVQYFSMMHSLDRLSIALDLEKKCIAQEKELCVLLEVNAAGERTKSGVTFDEACSLATEVAERCPHLKIQGLMTFPPYGEAESSRPYFSKLRDLAEQIEKKNIPGVSMRELSMGVSGDFEVAVEEGATIVRLGTVLFGRRK